MAYTNNIPTASQRLKDSQPLIQANFSGIKTLVDINHVTFDNANQGKHLYLQFPTVQGSDVATGAGEVAIYTKTGITNVPALFFRGQSNATVASGGFTEASATQNGWTRLPSGILQKWGKVNITAVSGATQVVTFPIGATIPAFSSTPFNFIITTENTNGSESVFMTATVSSTAFTVRNVSSSARNIYYFVTGV